MKTHLDRVNYQNIYNYSQDEFESILKFLQLDVEFWQDNGKLSKIEDEDVVNPYTVMKILFKGQQVKWQFGIDNLDNQNFIPYVRDQSKLGMAWINKFSHNKDFVLGLFLQLLKNGIYLKCNSKLIYIPQFNSVNELKMKIAIKYGINETPFKICL